MAQYIYETETVGKYTVNIIPDECAESPREWDNLGTIYSNHRNWNPDGHTMDEILKDDAEYIQDLRSDFKRDYVYFAIHMMDHSSYAFSLASIDAKRNNYAGYYMGFDCGTFGVMAVSKAKIRQEYGCKRITKKIMERVESCLNGEIKTFEAYANGYVYGFEVEDENGDVIDSCWGFFDSDDAMEQGKDSAKYYMEHEAA